MLKVVIADNGMLSIKYLEKYLTQIKEVDIVEKFTNSSAVLNKIENIKPDILFLDMSMHEIDGVELVLKVKALLPNCRIVFTTDYEEYAVTALDIGLEGYILRPFEKWRVFLLINRIIRARDKKVSKEDYSICEFKDFHFLQKN